MSVLPKLIPLAPAALTIFEGIRRESIGKARQLTGLSAGWHGKTPGRALRLALTIEYLTWAATPNASEPVNISGESMAHAATYLDYLEAMFDRVMRGMVTEQAEADAVNIMKWIVRTRPSLINERKLYLGSGFTHLRPNERRKEAFGVLANHGWIRQQANEGPGRKRGDWAVNPAALALPQ